MDIFGSLEGAICSLVSSTMRVIATALMTVKLDGLCSPYVSHQSVEFKEGHGYQGLVWVSNTRYDLILGGNEKGRAAILEKIQKEHPHQLELVKCEVPTAMIQDLFRAAEGGTLPGIDFSFNPRKNPFTTVYLPRYILDGWSKDGAPIYRQSDFGQEQAEWEEIEIGCRRIRLHKSEDSCSALYDGVEILEDGEWVQVVELDFDKEESLLTLYAEVEMEEEINSFNISEYIEEVRGLLYDSDGGMKIAGLGYDPELEGTERWHRRAVRNLLVRYNSERVEVEVGGVWEEIERIAYDEARNYLEIETGGEIIYAGNPLNEVIQIWEEILFDSGEAMFPGIIETPFIGSENE